MQELTLVEAAKFLGITQPRTRLLADSGRVKVRIVPRPHGKKRKTRRLYPISELIRIKAILDDPSYARPTKCLVCNTLFEHKNRYIRICNDCYAIQKECDCGCGTLHPKYSRRIINGGFVINKYANPTHALLAWHEYVRQTPEAYEARCETTREHWQNPSYRRKVLKSIANSKDCIIDKVRKGKRTNIETITDTELDRLGIEYKPDYRVSVYWIDCAILGAKIAIECDSDYYHSPLKAQERDARKDKYLIAHGWTVVRLSEDEIKTDIQQAIARKVLPLLN